VTCLAWVLARQLRSRWRSWALLAVLVGLAGAVVLTAAAGARRTDTAYQRFLDSAHAADVLVSPTNTGFGGYYGALARLPGAETVAPIIGVQALPFFLPGPKLVEAQVYAPADQRYGNVIERPRVVSGRLPDPTRVHEVALDLRAAKRLNAGVGGIVMLAATLSTHGPPSQEPPGLRLFRQRVVGIFMTRDNPVPINALAQLPVVYATPAFYATLGPPYSGFDGAYVRLRPGASAFRFERQAEALAQRYQATGGNVFVANLNDQAAQIERAIRPEAIALGLFALVVALTALVLVAQAILRQLRASRIDLTTLRALGLTRWQLWSITLLQVAAMTIVGALIAVTLAVLASPIMPLGAARVAEPSPGLDVDAVALGLGFVAIVVLLVAVLAWPSWRLSAETQATRDRRAAAGRGRRLAGLSMSAAPVTASLGIREALDPGTARGAVPVRSALVGTILSIVMVVGTLTFGANLVHLVTTPELYGQTWQASIDTQFQTIPVSFIKASLSNRPGVVAWADGNFGTVDVMGSHVPTIGLSRGAGPLVGPTLVTGRLPTRPDEIALGASVLRSVNRQVGQDLTVHVVGVQRKMHIVGQAVFPAFDQGSFTATDLGLGAAVTAADLAPPGTPLSDSYVFFLVRFAPGPDQARQVASFGRATSRYCSGVQQTTCFVTTQTPFDIGNYARIENVPEFLALVLAALGVGVLAQLMVVWVQRRRREIAILKTIGFVRRQVLALVAWQAGTFAALSLVVGIPLGIIAGRAAWALFANELGIASASVVPSTRIALCVPAVVLVAMFVALGPAWVASRVQPARVFRSE
jgi:ABC-type lipoprotein release transport system permease subunit